MQRLQGRIVFEVTDIKVELSPVKMFNLEAFYVFGDNVVIVWCVKTVQNV